MTDARMALSVSRNDLRTSRSAKNPLVTAQTVADSNARAIIATARGILATYLGAGGSQAWEAAGFLKKRKEGRQSRRSSHAECIGTGPEAFTILNASVS